MKKNIKNYDHQDEVVQNSENLPHKSSYSVLKQAHVQT